MKTIIRLTFGLISSLLLSAGLFRAAAQFDPLHLNMDNNPSDQRLAGPAGNCNLPCYFTPQEMLNPSDKLS